MKKNFTFGIVGFGKIGPRHKEKIEENNHCTLKAICDIDKTVLNKIEDDKVKLYQDYYEMLNRDDIDIVSVCTPNYLHAKMSIEALNAGKHVLCEKPMALTSKDCVNMIEAAHKNGKRLFIVKQNRYNPPVKAVKKILKENGLGTLFFLVLNCFWNRSNGYYENSSWKGIKDKDGGALFTQFSHFIDLIYWFGGNIYSVKACSENFHHPTIEIEDTGVVILKFINNALGSINFTNCAFANNMEGSITIFGEKGTIKIGGQYLNTIDYQKIDGFEIADLPKSHNSNDYGTYQGSMSNHDKVYDNIIDVLMNNGKIYVNGSEGMKSIRILEAIYESISTGDEVVL